MRRTLLMLVGSSILGALLFATAAQLGTASAPQPAPAVIGWYNGDWKSGLSGQANFFYKGGHFCRVYDDFVVPAGGWTVVGVFSNNRMADAIITKASWEIRRDMKPGKGGKKVASGVSEAKQVRIPGTGPFPTDAAIGYRIQVDGLRVRLKPGRYWLSVAPVGRGGRWYINGTLGKNAVGYPPRKQWSGIRDQHDHRDEICRCHRPYIGGAVRHGTGLLTRRDHRRSVIDSVIEINKSANEDKQTLRRQAAVVDCARRDIEELKIAVRELQTRR